MSKYLGSAEIEIQTRGFWLRSANASSVPCPPHPPNVKQDELKLLGEFDEAGNRSGQRMKLPPCVSSAAMSYDGFFVLLLPLWKSKQVAKYGAMKYEPRETG